MREVTHQSRISVRSKISSTYKPKNEKQDEIQLMLTRREGERDELILSFAAGETLSLSLSLIQLCVCVSVSVSVSVSVKEYWSFWADWKGGETCWGVHYFSTISKFVFSKFFFFLK